MKKTLASKLTSNEYVSKKLCKLISCELEMEYASRDEKYENFQYFYELF